MGESEAGETWAMRALNFSQMKEMPVRMLGRKGSGVWGVGGVVVVVVFCWVREVWRVIRELGLVSLCVTEGWDQVGI